MAQERANAFDFWGPRTLIGPELKPGDKARHSRSPSPRTRRSAALISRASRW